MILGFSEPMDGVGGNSGRDDGLIMIFDLGCRVFAVGIKFTLASQDLNPSAMAVIQKVPEMPWLEYPACVVLLLCEAPNYGYFVKAPSVVLV